MFIYIFIYTCQIDLKFKFRIILFIDLIDYFQLVIGKERYK